MMYYVSTLLLTLALVPALAQAGIVCEANEIDFSTSQGFSGNMEPKATRKPNTKKWASKTPNFEFNVTALGPEGEEDFYPQIALRTRPLTFVTVVEYKAKKNEGYGQITLTRGKVQGSINCYRE